MNTDIAAGGARAECKSVLKLMKQARNTQRMIRNTQHTQKTHLQHVHGWPQTHGHLLKPPRGSESPLHPYQAEPLGM